MSTAPTTFVSPSQLNSSLVYRKHSASPFRPARYSPYKLPHQAKSTPQLAGHAHSHTNIPPPPFDLSVASGAAHFTHEGETFEETRHVQLGFQLFRDGIQFPPSPEQYRQILPLFPTSFKLSFSPPYMIIACTKLPVKPWPVTVAGMPLYLTTDADDAPLDLGRSCTGPKVTIEANVAIWQTPDLETFQKLFKLFDSLGAKFHRIQWVGWQFLALGLREPYPDWKQRLPFTVNNVRIGYIFGEQTMQEKALRRKVPAGRVPDNEAYAELRPGILVASRSSGHEDNDDMTTSGVCLKSPSGKKYITVATQGFPGGVGDEVRHPSRHGQLIAQVAKVFGNSDIALAELGNVRYSRETFSAHDAPVSPFGNIANIFQSKIGDSIYMDTPYNGRCEGILMKLDALRLDDGPADEVEYLIGFFAYFGNGADTLFEGCCGGVLWNSDHDVLGQFRYQHDGHDSLCYCPTFIALRGLGYTVADA